MKFGGILGSWVGPGSTLGPGIPAHSELRYTAVRSHFGSRVSGLLGRVLVDFVGC
jgi:hypothetical protein